MPRIHVYLPDPLNERLESAAQRYSSSKSKLIARGVGLALDEIEGFPQWTSVAEPAAEAPSEPVATISDDAGATYSNPAGIAPLTDDEGTTWFQLRRVCQALGVPLEEVDALLDEEDKQVVGDEVCIADLGVRTALGVARNTGTVETVLSKFETWISMQQV